MPRHVRHRSCLIRRGSGRGVTSSASDSASRSTVGLSVIAGPLCCHRRPTVLLTSIYPGASGDKREAHVDAIVIGAGHNGLVAANLLADAGWSGLVLDAG